MTPKSYSHDLARQQRVAQAKSKVRALVKQGYRLDSSRASDTYNDALFRHGSYKESREAAGNMARTMRTKK